MKKILIAEDDGALRKLYKEMLTLTFEVIEAKSGSRALMSVHQEKPDLMLLDVQMPEMSGLEVLEAMNRDGLLAETKVVMLSNTSDDEVVARALALGAVGYLKKDEVELDQLRDICAQQLQEV